MTDSPRVLIFLLSGDWTGISHLPKAFIRAGFQVATLSPAGSYLSQTRYATRHIVMSPTANVLEFLSGVIRDAQPDLIIPGCEKAVRFLHRLVREHAGRSTGDAVKDASMAKVLALVRYSLGSPDGYDTTLSKHVLIARARTMALRVPDELPVYAVQDALLFAQKHGYPVVLKREYGAGGEGVRICRNTGELREMLSLLAPGLGMGNSPEVVVQQFIRGMPAMQVVSAMSGNVLERITALKEQCHPLPAGPSSVVRFIEHPEMDAAVNALLSALDFSGLCGVEFMVEEITGQAFVIELNPRPCPISHLGHLIGRDLIRALGCSLKGIAYQRVDVLNKPERIALFPQEWRRDPNSPALSQLYHDVPWDDPALLKALLR